MTVSFTPESVGPNLRGQTYKIRLKEREVLTDNNVLCDWYRGTDTTPYATSIAEIELTVPATGSVSESFTLWTKEYYFTYGSGTLQFYAEVVVDKPLSLFDYSSATAYLTVEIFPDDIYEDNDSYSEAKTLQLGLLKGLIQSDDYDWYVFNATSSDIGSTLAVQIEFFDELGGLESGLFRNCTVLNCDMLPYALTTASNRRTVSYQIDAAGKYYFVVSSKELQRKYINFYDMLSTLTPGSITCTTTPVTGISVPSTDSDGSYTVSWSPVAGALYYDLIEYEYENGNQVNWRMLPRVSTGTSINITGRSDGRTYYYDVYATAGSCRMSDPVRSSNGCAVRYPDQTLLGQAVDNTNLLWRTGSAYSPNHGTYTTNGWFSQATVTSDGVDAAQSGSTLLEGSTSWMKTEVAGPGTLSFYWKVSSLVDGGILRFYIDGQEQAGSISGVVDWQQKSFAIPVGTHTLMWEYAKELPGSSGSDAGWVDRVVLTPEQSRVWAWGYNYHGQLGDNTNVDRITPVQVLNLTGVVAVTGGGRHSLALKSDGTVWAWGSDAAGQLGDNSTVSKRTPVQVLNLTGVVAITGGGSHSLALKSDGTVWAWGDNLYGQLGDNTAVDKHTPVQVLNLTGVVAITGGGSHSLALKSDGTVWTWGYNYHGQLGDNTNVDRITPVQVSNLTGIIAIAGGLYHSLALKSDGTVWAWGLNGSGQLGDNTTVNKNIPTQVLNLTGVVAIAGGSYHSLALKSDGTVWAWGLNSNGQLGDNTLAGKSAPVQVLNLTGVLAIEAGKSHCLALKSNNTVSDSIQPTLNIISHSNNGNVSNTTIVLSGTATDTGRGDSGIGQVTVNGSRAMNDTVAGSGTANWSIPLTLNSGSNAFTVVALDNSANHNQTSQTITLNYNPTDTTPPVVAVTSHTNNAIVTLPCISIFGTATDSGTGNSGIQQVTVNSLRAANDTASGSGTANWSKSSTLSVGSNVFSIVAYDNSPNHNATTLSPFTLNYTPDGDAPAKTVTSHTNGQTVSTANVTLSGTASDGSGRGNNGVSSVKINGTRANNDTTTGGNTANWSIPLTLSPGANILTIEACDSTNWCAGSNNCSSTTFTLNYSAAITTTAIGNGTDPSNATIAPSGSVTPLDAFTLQTSSGTDTVTGLTVLLAAGTSSGLSRVGIWSGSNCTGTEYGFVANPLSDTVAITLGTNITANTTLTPYYGCVTPKTHANMPVPPGTAYAVTGTVTSITSTNAKTYSDTSSATVTIDNLSPANTTGFSGTPGNTQVVLNWTNPVSDFSQVVILRKTGSAVTDTPSEGAAYTAGNTIGTSTVRYVGSVQPFTDTGLTNGTAYYYKIFAKDSNGNYSSGGIEAGPYTPSVACTPSALSVTITTPTTGFAATQGSSTAVSANVKDNCTNSVTGAAVNASFNNGDTGITLYDDGTHGDGAANDGVYANTWTPNNTGTVAISLSAAKAGLTSGNAQVSGTVQAAQTGGLVAYYPLDNNSNDMSGNANHGISAGGLTYVAGNIAQAANFDAVDDQIDISTVTTLKTNTPKSIFAWIKLPDGLSSAGQGYLRSIVDSSVDAHWRVLGICIEGSSYKPCVKFSQNSIDLRSAEITHNEWHFIGFTWEPNSTIKLYVDGNLSTETSTIITAWDTVSALSTFIGRQFENPSGHYFNGLIDDVRIYDTALSAAEIQALYYSYSQLETGLVSYYKLDEASGTAVSDSIGANNGAVTGSVITVGKLNNARSFSAGNYVTIPHSASIDAFTAFTLSAWVYPTNLAPAGWNTIISKGGTASHWPHYAMILNSNGTIGDVIHIYSNEGSGNPCIINTSPAITSNTWHHITFVHEGTGTDQTKLYQNGSLIGQCTLMNPTATSEPLYISRWRVNADLTFFGTIDEVGIWNRALTALEVSDLFNGGIGLSYPFAVDTTPPVVSITSPADNDSGVSPNSQVTINWNEDIDCTTVTPSTVTISPAVSWQKISCSGSQAVFVLGGQANATQYTVTVGTGVKDAVGTAMSAAYSFKYTTTDITYTSLTLLTPNGGEKITTGSTYQITWGAPAEATKFTLQYSINNGTAWKTIATNVTGNSYPWTLPPQTANKPNCLLKITGYNTVGSFVGTDTSNAVFRMEVIKLNSPNGGESWNSGTVHPITWTTGTSIKPISKVNLYYKIDATGYKLITSFTGTNPGTYEWTVPTVTANKLASKVKVELVYTGITAKGNDINDANFTIKPAGAPVAAVEALDTYRIQKIGLTNSGIEVSEAVMNMADESLTEEHSTTDGTMLLWSEPDSGMVGVGMKSGNGPESLSGEYLTALYGEGIVTLNLDTISYTITDGQLSMTTDRGSYKGLVREDGSVFTLTGAEDSSIFGIGMKRTVLSGLAGVYQLSEIGAEGTTEELSFDGRGNYTLTSGLTVMTGTYSAAGEGVFETSEGDQIIVSPDSEVITLSNISNNTTRLSIGIRKK
ncbi:MAG: Ig-like domain-containing protein [Nitrospirae bacterium]|nr:Ig-like domain-containing protein [Nitrospirota bacterium]